MNDIEKRNIANIYRNMIEHYFSKGLGEKSDLSHNTIITPKLVRNVLNRYIELGGNEDYFLDDKEYKTFLDEVSEKFELENEEC